MLFFFHFLAFRINSFYSRSIGTFIAVRLMSWNNGDGKKDEYYKAKLISNVSAVAQNKEFEIIWNRVDEMVECLNNEDEQPLALLKNLVAKAGSWGSRYAGYEMRLRL